MAKVQIERQIITYKIELSYVEMDLIQYALSRVNESVVKPEAKEAFEKLKKDLEV